MHTGLTSTNLRWAAPEHSTNLCRSEGFEPPLWAETALMGAQISAWMGLQQSPVALPVPLLSKSQESSPLWFENNQAKGQVISVPVLSEWLSSHSPKTSLPRDANCLWRAKRDCTLVFSSFMVVSMWLALREWSAITVCCGWQQGTHLSAPRSFF